MLRRELVIGYTVAGFLTILVPRGVWNTSSCTATDSGRASRTSSSVRSSPSSVSCAPSAMSPWPQRCGRAGSRSAGSSRSSSPTSSRSPAARLPPLLRDPPHPAHPRPVLGRHVDRRAGHRRDLPRRRPHSADTPHQIAPEHFSWDYHDLSQHHLPGGVRPSCIGPIETESVSAAGRDPPATRYAACRSRLPTRRLPPTTRESGSTSAPTTAAPASRAHPTASRPRRRSHRRSSRNQTQRTTNSSAAGRPTTGAAGIGRADEGGTLGRTTAMICEQPTAVGSNAPMAFT